MTLNKILAFDALTCAVMGLVLIIGAAALSALLALPENLLAYAGWLLIPIAIFMAILSRQAMPWTAGVWLVIIGNVGWVIASLYVLAYANPNGLGVGFVLVQALVVAALAVAEFNAGPRRTANAA